MAKDRMPQRMISESALVRLFPCLAPLKGRDELHVVVAFFGPTGLLTLATGRLWRRLDGWRWREAVQRGLAPVAIGLLVAGSISLAKSALTGWRGAAVAATVFVLLIATRINPAVLVLCGAAVGLVAFGGS